VSEALDTVHDECANGRLSPAVAESIKELDARVRRLEDAAENHAAGVTDTANGGE
jgi:hypothetical protein